MAAKGVGWGGRTPTSPGVPAPYPATPPLPGAAAARGWGGTRGLPAGGGEAAIDSEASQRLNRLMIQKSMGKGEGRAEGVASRRAAPRPPLAASTSDSAGGGGQKPESLRSRRRLQHLGQCPAPEPPPSRRRLQHLGQRRERRALPGGAGGNGGENRDLWHSGSGTPAPPPPIPPV